MAIYLYTVESSWSDEFGLSVERGIPMSEIPKRQELNNLNQGVTLELRLPSGTRRRTTLVNYGVGVIEQEDGSLIVEGDPCIRFTLPIDLSTDDVPAGTEIWWITEEDNEAGQL